MCRARRPATCSACRHARRVPRHDILQASLLFDGSNLRCPFVPPIRRSASGTAGRHPAARSDPRYFDVVACRSRDSSLPSVAVVSSGPGITARRVPCGAQRHGTSVAVKRPGSCVGRISGNVSGTHLFSARQHRARGSGSSAAGAATRVGQARAAVGTREIATAGQRVSRHAWKKMFHRRDLARVARGPDARRVRRRSG